MKVKELSVKSFRAHEASTIKFGLGLNVIHGDNGAGKTNLLEAIHYLGLSKSFVSANDRFVLRKGAQFMEVLGSFEGEQRSALQIRFAFEPGVGKKFFVNKAPLDKVADLVGQIPMVILSPTDYVITAGPPDERRQFLNKTLSQMRSSYLLDLMQYRRSLKQRNALLQNYRFTRRLEPGSLTAWNDQLSLCGANLIKSRSDFTKQFSGYLADSHALMGDASETPKIRYKTILEPEKLLEMEVGDIQQALLDRFQTDAPAELEKGKTMSGPHRDDLEFSLDDMTIRQYASQGQHRTFGLALKLAKFHLLKDTLDETPILMLDDVFGNLDANRTTAFMEMLAKGDLGQVIVTIANLDLFKNFLETTEGDHTFVEISNGKVI